MNGMRSLAVIGAVVLALGGIFALNTNNAEAFPKYAQKEKKPCNYCHVKPAGGGKRTAAGEWYKTHLSFVGYKPGAAAAPPPAAGKPAVKPAAKPTPKPKAKATPKPKAKATPKPKKKS